jgi:DNA-binding winged helix-turn-helix (wHTH) protein/TolB-like protein
VEEVRIGSHILQPNRQLLVDGVYVHLGARAVRILTLLAEANGAILTKDEIFDAVWPGLTVEENALQAHISAIRKSLGEDAGRLETLRGVGYRLKLGPNDAAPDLPLGGLPSEPDSDSHPKPTRWRALAATILGLLMLFAIGWWAPNGTRAIVDTPAPIPVLVRPLTASGGGDQTEVVMASGITDELTMRLRRIPDLSISRVDAVGSIAASPGTGYVVDGTIFNAEGRVRVTARLSDHDGRVIWMRTFDRSISDLFAIQEEIAAAVASELAVSLDVGVNSTEYGGTSNPEAFAAYIQYTVHRLDQDQGSAKRYLDRALSLDPSYIKAMSGQAIWYGMQARRTATRGEGNALLTKMRDGVDRALAANPDLWIGYMTKGWYHLYEKDYSASDDSFEFVASLDEGVDPELRGFLSSQALIMGRTTESLSLLASNVLIDPARKEDRSQVWALSQAGHHREAIDLFERLAPIYQDSVAGNAFWAHMVMEGDSRAAAFAERRVPSLARLLDRFKADQELTSMVPNRVGDWANRHFGEGGHLELGALAAFAGYYGHKELAVELLRASYERVGATPAIFWNPVLASTRETNEFAELMTDLGFTGYWRSSGNWPDYCSPVSASEITCH